MLSNNVKKVIKNHLFDKFNINCIRFVPEIDSFCNNEKNYVIKATHEDNKLDVYLVVLEVDPDYYSFYVSNIVFTKSWMLDPVKFFMGDNPIQKIINDVYNLFEDSLGFTIETAYLDLKVLSGSFSKSGKRFDNIIINDNLSYSIVVYTRDKYYQPLLDIIVADVKFYDNKFEFKYGPDTLQYSTSFISGVAIGSPYYALFDDNLKEQFGKDLLQEIILYYKKENPNNMIPLDLVDFDRLSFNDLFKELSKDLKNYILLEDMIRY